MVGFMKKTPPEDIVVENVANAVTEIAKNVIKNTGKNVVVQAAQVVTNTAKNTVAK